MPDPPTESLGQTQSIRRSVTLPTKLIPQTQRAPNLGENVVFYHPSAKIVHFAPKALFPIPTSSTPTDFDYPVDTIETLPWRSATERTVATAPLRLEKVHGLTVFLKCGNVVHAILKNSQCWCVDGVSKFVLRIRPLTYYRIEIPFDSEDDKGLVEQLKAALPTVLRYEVTPCPFKRAFTVELPEEATAPRRKRAWQPKARKDSLVSLAGSAQGPPSDVGSEGPELITTDDTDETATDDSESVLKEPECTTSEALSVGDSLLASTNTSEAPMHPRSGRRAVTETPQTFSALRAKFDASPSREQSLIPDVSVRAPDAPDVAQEDGGSRVSDIDMPPPKSTSAQESEVAESSIVNDVSLDTSPLAETQPSPVTSSQEKFALFIAQPATEDNTPSESHVPRGVTDSHGTSDQVADGREESCASQEETIAQQTVSHGRSSRLRLESSSDDSQSLEESHLKVLSPYAIKGSQQLLSPTQIGSSQESLEEESIGADHDSAFSSSPDSFHSAGLSSQSDSLPQRNLSNDSQDANQQDWTFSGVPTTNKVSSEASSTSSGLRPGVSSISDNPNSSAHVGTSSKFAFYETRSDTTRPTLAIPSESRRASQASIKSVSPATDLNHMSTEFRRRAQATRHRDVSPMPPPSAIYQPSPNEKASSILSKTLALVLVPPISLFIILLHITARIAISPTFGLSNNASAKASHTSRRESITEDDFSFPLEREGSSDYEDAEMSHKSDPWDLD